MKQFTKKELSELKLEVAHGLERKDSLKSLVYVYYTSFEVLRYLDFLGEENVSQIDLQFWVHANEVVMREMTKLEAEALPLFNEMSEFEDSLLRARHMCFHSQGDKQCADKYYALLEQQQQRREYYGYLRRAAGIYLDILSDNPEDEKYKLWLFYYNRLSRILDEPERGFAEEDQVRLSLPELEILLKQCEDAAKNDFPARRLLYWNQLIFQFGALIRARRSE